MYLLLLVAGAAQRLPGRAVQAEIDRAIAAGAASVSVSDGEYLFTGASLRIVGGSNLHITGWGATLFFDCGYGVHIANSSTVTFEGFVQDYTRPCFAQGVVRSVSKPAGATQYADIKFDLENFPSPGNRTEFPWAGGSGPPPLGRGGVAPPMNGISVKVTFWEPTTTRMIAHGNHLFVNATAAAAVPDSSDDPSVFRVGFTGAAIAPGLVPPGSLATVHYRLGLADPASRQPVATGTAGGLTYLITNSSAVKTVNHSLHGGGTEALVEAGGAGGHVWQDVFLGRRPEHQPLRLLAANADGFHSSCVRSGPTLERVELSWTGDDLLNIHSRISVVLEVLSETAAYIIDTEGVSAPGDYDVSTLMLEQTRVGDLASFFTLKLEPMANATVSSLQRTMDPAVVQRAKDAWSEINSPPYSQGIRHDFGHRVWLVNWSVPLSQPLTQFALVDVPRLRNNGTMMRNCHLHDGYMRIGLYDSPGATVANNTFERSFPMNVGESGDGWLEGPPVVNGVLVEGNLFKDTVGGTPIVVHAPFARSVVLKGNVCTQNGSSVPCTGEKAVRDDPNEN
jgi:hypothetical protein